MLSFMRKHQKYFFILITFVIVISFSFFGTYSTLAGNSIHEQTAFTAVDGQAIPRSELEEMALFIGTDSEDKKLFGGIWGPNFLNDGVIRKNFLEPGLANILISTYAQDLQGDFINRFAKEVRYQPYVHPQAKFISSQNTWSSFAPQIASQLKILQKSINPLDATAVDARVQLFLAERRFPSPYLKQVLGYQENQQNSIQKDPALYYQDLSLFGYHTLEDWFGGRFIRLISEFIINAAAISQERGYVVSKEEALADLMRNADISFKENKANPQIGVASSAEYLDQQLARMRLDKPKATKIWQKVLLFRRLFADIASAVFVDPLSYEAFNQYANNGISGDLYQIPRALRFSDFKTFQKFEIYLDKVAKKSKEEKNILLMPKEYLTASEVMKKTPELVQKRYLLEIASVSKNDLESQVTLKQGLAWELDEQNWPQIKKEVPEIGLNNAKTSEDRLSALESLDSMTRSRLDRYVRGQIVASHPEWIDSALDKAKIRQEKVNLTLKGPNAAFEGLVNGEDLMALLDKAKDEPLQKVSFDQNHYYRIKVIEKSPNFEILTFDEAAKGTLLDSLVDQALEVAYVQLRTQNPSLYQNSDKSWKPFAEVRSQVALSHFGKTLDAIKLKLKASPDKEKFQNLDQERLVPYRFIAEAEDLLKKLEARPELSKELTKNKEEQSSLEGQFKWTKEPLKMTRQSSQQLAENDKLFRLPKQKWSEVITAPNGDLYFAYVADDLKNEESTEELQLQVKKARLLLGYEAERTYLHSLIPLLKDKHAISFDYLYSGESSLEAEG